MRSESIGQIFRNTNGALKVIKLLGKPTRLVNSTVIDTRARSFERMHVVSNVLSFMRDWRLFTSDEFARGSYNRTSLFVARKMNLTWTRPRKKRPWTEGNAVGNRFCLSSLEMRLFTDRSRYFRSSLDLHRIKNQYLTIILISLFDIYLWNNNSI